MALSLACFSVICFFVSNFGTRDRNEQAGVQMRFWACDDLSAEVQGERGFCMAGA